MANEIVRVHKLGKHNRNRPDMTTYIITVLVSISKCHNTKYKNIDMTLNSSSTNTTSSTTTDYVHEKTADTIENKSSDNSKNDQNPISNVSVDDDSQ